MKATEKDYQKAKATIKAYESQKRLETEEHNKRMEEKHRNCAEHEYLPVSYKWRSITSQCINCGHQI